MMKKKRARRASLAYRVNILIFVITFIVSLLMVVICDSDYRKAVLVPYTRKLAALEVHPEEFTPYTEHFMKFFGTEELQNAKASLDTENDYFIDWLDKQPSFTADDAEFGRRSLFLDWISADLALEEIMLSIDLDEACLEVQKNQKVIDTRLYGIVRHPMYMSTLFLFLSMPLVLGSVISFVITLLYIPIISKRIRNEEQVLEKGLDGYTDYEKRVRYRVIPFVW